MGPTGHRFLHSSLGYAGSSVGMTAWRGSILSFRVKRGISRPVTKEELHEDLEAIIDKAKEQQSLTGMVTVVVALLRLLGAKLVRMVLEQRDDQLHRGRRGAPCCPRCGTRLRKPERKAISRMTILGRLRYWRL